MALEAHALSRSTLALGVIPEHPEIEESAELIALGRRLTRDLSTLAASLDPDEAIAAFHPEIANQPGSCALNAIPTEILVPHCLEKLRKYLELKGEHDCLNFADLLSEKEKLYLTILYIKDNGDTAENTLDLLIWTHHAIKKLPSLQDLDPEQIIILKRACLLHDLGKINLPAIVIENPIPRELQGKIYEWYLLDPSRPPIQSPIPLDAEQEARFKPLLNGQAPDEEKHALAKELASKEFDKRQVIPTAFLLESSAKILEDVDAQRETFTHLQEQSGVQNPGAMFSKMMQELQNQKNALINEREQILATHKISPDESFKTTLDRHEAISLVLANHANNIPKHGTDRFSRVCHISSRHHDNPITQDMRRRLDVLPNAAIPENDKILYHAIRIFDIVAALQQHRAYKTSMNNATIVKILRKLVEDEFLDQKLTEEFIGKFLS